MANRITDDQLIAAIDKDNDVFPIVDVSDNTDSPEGTNKKATTEKIKSAMALTKTDVGLSNVDNTADTNKPVSTAQAAADLTAENNAKSYADSLVVENGFWRTVHGNPTRSSNTVFTITDAGNANLYDKLIGKLTVLKWTDSGSTKMAMVVNASYSSNTVTITINGDILSGTATMNTLKYSIEKAREVVFAVAGTIGTGTNISRQWRAKGSIKIFSGVPVHGTAGTTNATTYDVNKNGTTMFTTKPSVGSGSTDGGFFTSDDGTTLSDGDVLTLDCDSVSTTAPVDAYITVFWTFLNYQYQT